MNAKQAECFEEQREARRGAAQRTATPSPLRGEAATRWLRPFLPVHHAKPPVGIAEAAPGVRSTGLS